ncbi:MAG: DUF5906 domain-containing protein [Shimia thalassica]
MDGPVLPGEIAPLFDDTLDRLKNEPNDKDVFNFALLCIADTHMPFQAPLVKRLAKQTENTVGVIRTMVAKFSRELAASKSGDMLNDVKATHVQIARHYQEYVPSPGIVASGGKFWTYRHVQGLWIPRDMSEIGVQIATKYSDFDHCKRANDYTGLTKTLYTLCADESFFDKAPEGVATEAGFWRMKEGKVVCEPHSPDNRALFALTCEPVRGVRPALFTSTLLQAFTPPDSQMENDVANGKFVNLEDAKFHYVSEGFEQIRALQMLFGATLFGMLPRLEKAVLLYGKAGSFKSKTLELLRKLVDSDAVCSISPLELDNEYRVARLANKRLNAVPEIDAEKPVPAAAFKAVIGGDLVSGRVPYGQVFEFVPRAANWFNGNYYLTTRDTSSAFWRRWYVIRFWSGKGEGERDETLVHRIAENELAQIIGWAFDGAERLQAEGLRTTQTHLDCLAEWQNSFNSVVSWLSSNDAGVYRRNENDHRPEMTSVEAFECYKRWCADVHRKPFGRNKFLANMREHGFPYVNGPQTTTFPTLTRERW